MSIEIINGISGVEIKPVKTFPDERGMFAELIRITDSFFTEGFGQLSTSTVYQGVIKAWHAHKVQYQWTYVISGCLKVALYDNRKDSETFGKVQEMICGDDHDRLVYGFPPGILHGYKCIAGPANVLYVTSATYDLEDEVRVSHQDIEYDWVNNCIK